MVKMNKGELTAELQKRTAYDDLVVGCFLTNYGIPGRCGAFRSYGCKDAARCKRLDGVLAKMYEEGVRLQNNQYN